MNRLFFVFTVDGDWKEYFATRLSDEARQPNKYKLISLVKREIKLASTIKGKFLHFIHYSPIAGEFFLKPEFIALWRKIEAGGGEIGIHCHEETLYSRWYYDDPLRMEQSISKQVNILKNHGLSPRSYRGGYMSFSTKLIPILEKNALFLDFSCDPGRYMVLNNQLVSDWREASDNFYRMSYDNHTMAGNSQVFEIPLGIYIEKQSLWSIWRKARRMNNKKHCYVVSVMAHTYDFASLKMRLKLKLSLFILKVYGTFITPEEALKIMKDKI